MQTEVVLLRGIPGPWVTAILAALHHPCVEARVYGTPSDKDVVADIKVSPVEDGPLFGLRVAMCERLGLRIVGVALDSCPVPSDEITEVRITDEVNRDDAALRETRGRWTDRVSPRAWHTWDVRSGFIGDHAVWLVEIHASTLDRANEVYRTFRYPVAWRVQVPRAGAGAGAAA